MKQLRDNDVLERPKAVRRSLKAKTYLARLAWLNAPLRWEADRVVRIVPAPGGEGTAAFVPAISDIAQAEYCRNRLTALLRAETARRETDTLQRMTDALRLAKRLFALQERAGDASPIHPADIPPVIEWLIPEALAENLAPYSPAHRLLMAAQNETLRPVILAGLRSFLADATVPHSAHLLAAVLLGALSRHEQADPSESASPSPGCRRALRWARQRPLLRGIPIALLARFLGAEEGERLAEQAIAALSARRDAAPNPAELLPTADDLWALLNAGRTPGDVADLAGIMAGNAPLLAERLLQRRYHADELPENLPRVKERERRKEAAERVRQGREATLSKLAATRWRLISVSPNPATVCARTDDFIHRALDAWHLPTAVWESILVIPLAELPRRIAPEGFATALTLLTENYPDLYPQERFTIGNLVYHDASASDWFRERKNNYVLPLLSLLRDTSDPKLAREAIRRQLLPFLYPQNTEAWKDPGTLRYAVHCAKYLDITASPDTVYSEGISELYDFLRRHYNAVSEARAEFTPLLHALQPLEPFLKSHLLDVWLSDIGYHTPKPEAQRNLLRRMEPYFGVLAGFAAARENETDCSCHTMMKALIAVIETAGEMADVLFTRLVDLLKDKDVGEYYWLSEGVQIAAMLAPENPTRFIEIVRVFFNNEVSVRREFQVPALAALRAYPALRAPFAARFAEEPHRCLRLLSQLGRLWQRMEGAKLSASPNPLQTWEMRTAGTNLSNTVSADAGDWQSLRDLAPDLAPTIADYWHACWVRGDSLEAPKGIREILGLPERLARELDYLETAVGGGSASPEQRVRRDNLRAQLADTEGMRRRTAAEARERMQNATTLLQLDAVEQTLQESILVELRCLVGPRAPLPRYVDDDLLNAIEIGSGIECNKKLMVKMLRAYFSGEAAAFIENHPANRRFRQWAAAQGIDVSRWLGEHSEVITLPTGQAVRLYLETDPLRVLQMGTLFGTCLSANDINAFSTVANACDQNKRVLYACDVLTGRTLARKLIAVTEAGTLVGFNTYTRLGAMAGRGRPAATDALISAVDTFLKDFAGQCRLPLEDAGTVPTLMSEDWYNDGTVSWQREESGTLTPCKPSSPGQPALSAKHSVPF